MAPSTIQYYMNYVIFFQDDAEYQFAVAVAGGNLLELAPRDAAVLFGIPYPYPSGDMSSIPRGIYFLDPFTPGSEFRFPGPSGIFVDDAVLTKVVPGQAGTPASIWPAGPSGTFTWSGNIVKNGGASLDSEPVPTAMPNRRWIFGRELLGGAENSLNGDTSNVSRDFSRTIDGLGIGIRGNIINNSFRNDVNRWRTLLQPRTSWERFYFRVRNLPIGFDVGIWRCSGFPSANAGCGLKIMQAGTIVAFDINAVGTETSKGTVLTPVLNQWYRLDVLLKYGNGSQPGIIAIYINNVFTFTYSDSVLGGMSGNTRHTLSELGKWNSVGGEHDAEVDLDDWIGADLPSNCDPATLGFIDNNYPIDWILGSHVRQHTTLSASQTNWAPAGMAVGILNQWNSPAAAPGTTVLTSSTSGATLEGLTDALPMSIPDSIANIVGVASGLVCLRSQVALGTDGTLGYRKAGAAATLITIDQQTTQNLNFASYNIVNYAAMILPDEVSPWSLTHVKSADANLDTSTMMMTVLEYIGIWGPEDDPLFAFPINRLTFLHNAPYGNTPWGYLGSQPSAPCYAIGGTYVGNGTYQEFTLPAPCNFLWIRAITGTSQGCKFFSSAVGPCVGGLERLFPGARMWYDFINELFKFSVVGGVASDINVSGTTYQYIAFCDPGMRFSLNGAYCHDNAGVSPRSNPLIDSTFLPIACFFQRNLDSSGSNIEGLFFRGPGSPANQANGLQGATVVANGANFTSGNINTLSGLHGNPFAYSAWRTADSGGVCTGIMVQIGQYTGDGTASRAITLTPTSGRVPLLVMVVPTNAQTAFMRDPSHTGNNSSVVGTGANSTTAILAVAIDQITAGIAINANGIVYNFWAICGGTTNVNGTYVSDFCEGGGPYLAPSPPTGDINILGNGGLSLDGTTPTTILKDVSGLYTIVTGKRNDTLIDRQTGQTSVDVKIPDPTFKTGYVGG